MAAKQRNPVNAFKGAGLVFGGAGASVSTSS
jgi:hypothetical protein